MSLRNKIKKIFGDKNGITINESDFYVETLYNRTKKGNQTICYQLTGLSSYTKPTVGVPDSTIMVITDSTTTPVMSWNGSEWKEF